MKIAVLIPCLNEATTIAQVIGNVRAAVPEAEIWVCDNGCTDSTAQIARDLKARVVLEMQRGKGHAIRRLFACMEADIYVMVDGDGTYDLSALPVLIGTLLNEQLDMVIGGRAGIHQDAKRKGHAFGNALFNRLFAWLFGRAFTDIFSGYRVMSRRFVKSFPALSNGFEIETEMAVHIRQLGLSAKEIMLPYVARPEGSASKLRSFQDGGKIALMFALLMKETRPFAFFSFFACLCTLTSLGLALPVLITYVETGLVPRLPTAILAMGFMLIAFLFLACGIILDSIARGRREYKRLVYVNQA